MFVIMRFGLLFAVVDLGGVCNGICGFRLKQRRILDSIDGRNEEGMMARVALRRIPSATLLENARMLEVAGANVL